MPIATTKTTVLGIRLDHDRRAWVEDVAAREGVTVRAFFERLIDEARVEEMTPEVSTDVSAAPSTPSVPSVPSTPSVPPPVRPAAPSATNGGVTALHTPATPLTVGPVRPRPAAAGLAGESVTQGVHDKRPLSSTAESPAVALAHVVSLSGQMVWGVARMTAACLRTAGHYARAPWRMAAHTSRR